MSVNLQDSILVHKTASSLSIIQARPLSTRVVPFWRSTLHKKSLGEAFPFSECIIQKKKSNNKCLSRSSLWLWIKIVSDAKRCFSPTFSDHFLFINGQGSATVFVGPAYFLLFSSLVRWSGLCYIYQQGLSCRGNQCPPVPEGASGRGHRVLFLWFSLKGRSANSCSSWIGVMNLLFLKNYHKKYPWKRHCPAKCRVGCT